MAPKDPPDLGSTQSRRSREPSSDDAERELSRAAARAREQRPTDDQAIRRDLPRVTPPPTPAAQAAADRRAAEYDSARRSAEARDRAELMQRHCGVPERYRVPGWGAWPDLPADVRERYLAAAGQVAEIVEARGIVGLLGPRGAGKTAIAAGLVYDWARHGRRAQYMLARSLVARLREDPEPRDLVRAVELLVIDHLELVSAPWELDALMNLIDGRYSIPRATIITSNQTAEALEAAMPSVVSRMLDDGGIVETTWPSLRGRIGRADDWRNGDE